MGRTALALIAALLASASAATLDALELAPAGDEDALEPVLTEGLTEDTEDVEQVKDSDVDILEADSDSDLAIDAESAPVTQEEPAEVSADESESDEHEESEDLEDEPEGDALLELSSETEAQQRVQLWNAEMSKLEQQVKARTGQTSKAGAAQAQVAQAEATAAAEAGAKSAVDETAALLPIPHIKPMSYAQIRNTKEVLEQRSKVLAREAARKVWEAAHLAKEKMEPVYEEKRANAMAAQEVLGRELGSVLDKAQDRAAEAEHHYRELLASALGRPISHVLMQTEDARLHSQSKHPEAEASEDEDEETENGMSDNYQGKDKHEDSDEDEDDEDSLNDDEVLFGEAEETDESHGTAEEDETSE